MPGQLPATEGLTGAIFKGASCPAYGLSAASRSDGTLTQIICDIICDIPELGYAPQVQHCMTMTVTIFQILDAAFALASCRGEALFHDIDMAECCCIVAKPCIGRAPAIILASPCQATVHTCFAGCECPVCDQTAVH